MTDFGFQSECQRLAESLFRFGKILAVAKSGNTVIPTFVSEIRDLIFSNEKLE